MTKRQVGRPCRSRTPGAAARRYRGVLLAAWLTAAAALLSAQPATEPLHRFEVPVVGVALEVGPAAQRLPLGLPARVRTELRLPDPMAVWAEPLRAYFRDHFRVRGDLVPPAGSGGAVVGLECVPGDPLEVGALALPGLYRLRDLRLVSLRDGRDFLFAQPESVDLEVGGELFITWVNAEPMSLEEMLAEGVVFDENSYQNYKFVVAFELAGEVVEFDFPVLAGRPALPATPYDWSGLQIGDGDCLLGEIRLDLTGHPLPELGAGGASVPGLIVIPGGVSFLQQHFQVILVLCNALPPGSGYSFENLVAEAALPTPGQYQPGDPLSLAPVASGTNTAAQPILPVAGGTVIPPGAPGSAGWIVRGHQTGYHEFDIAIRGTLRSVAGDTGWPVAGLARAGVAVRDNPRFCLTFIHPDRVEAGAEYELAVTATNVGTSAANGFRLSVDSAGLSGVDWVCSIFPDNPGDPCPNDNYTYEQAVLAPGESVVLRYRLRARVSGMVTASYAGADDPHLEANAQLIFGVDAAGEPMNPHRLVLPAVAAYLGPGLYEPALAIVGLCHALSITARETLGNGFGRVGRAEVQRLALALAEAGLAIRAGMARERALALLVGDLAEIASADDGFRTCLATTTRGIEFRQALQAALDPGGDPETLAETLVSALGHRGDFCLVLTPLQPAAGARALVAFPGAGAAAGVWLIQRPPDPAGILLEGFGVAWVRLYCATSETAWQTWRYNCFMGAGQTVRLPAGALLGSAPVLQLLTDGHWVADLPPDSDSPGEVPLDPFVLVRVLKANPELIKGADLFGRSVFGLFNRPVAVPPGRAADMFLMAGNELLAALPLLSGRLVGMVWNRPLGRFQESAVTLGDVRAADGSAAPPGPHAVWLPDPASPCERGLRVFGRVRWPDGRAVANPRVELWALEQTFWGRRDTLISRFSGEADGSFRLEWAYLNPAGLWLRVSDPASGQQRRFPLRPLQDGLVLRPEIILSGYGSVTGQVVDQDGLPVPGVWSVRVHALGDGRTEPALLEAGGMFRLDGVAVGGVEVEAFLADRWSVRGYGYLGAPGETAFVLLVAGQANVTGRVVEWQGVEWRTVPGACLEWVHEASHFRTVSETGTDGTFAFSGVPWGGFRLRCLHPGKPAVTEAAGWVGAAGSVDLELQFDASVRLSGQVRAREAGGGWSPVSYAMVRLNRQDAWESFELEFQTALNGTFECDQIPLGYYEIIARQPETLAEQSERLWLAPGENQVVLELPARARLAGLILAAGGSPAAGARLAIGGQEILAGDDGRFSLWLIPGGHRYLARLGDEVENGVVDLDPHGTDMVIRLRGRRSVSGHLVDPAGNGLQATIGMGGTALLESGLEYRAALAATSSTSTGAFEFVNVYDGRFDVSFEGNAFYWPARQSGHLQGADIHDLQLVAVPLATAGEILGRVWQRDGTSPARAGLLVSMSGQGGLVREARTDGEGRFRFAAPIPPGHHLLECTDLYSGDLSREEIQFAGGMDMTVDLVMLGRNTLRVHLFDAAGNRLEEAFLQVKRLGLPACQRAADSVWESDFEGGAGVPAAFCFQNLYAGDYSVAAVHCQGESCLEISGGITLAGNGHDFDLVLVLEPAGIVRGLVLDAPGGKPVPGAEVRLADSQGNWAGVAVTRWEMAELGRFELPAAPAGAYMLEALDLATGRRAWQAVEIPPEGDPVEVELCLQPLGRVIGVAVSGNGDSHSCQDTSALVGLPVRLEVHPANGSPYPAMSVLGSTGSDGRFAFEGVPAGRLALSMDDASGVSAYLPLELSPGETACLVLPVEETFGLSGRVWQAGAGGGAPHARVELRPVLEGGRAYRTVTVGDGSFALAQVHAGAYRLAAWTAGGLDRVEMELEIPAELYRELTLGGVGAASGWIANHSGTRRVAGATVRWTSAAGVWEDQVRTSGVEGAFFFPELPAGEFRVTAGEPGTGLEGALAGWLEHGQWLEGVEVALEPAYSLFARVEEAAGGAAAGAAVSLSARRPDGRIFERTTGSGDGGAFLLDRLPQLNGMLAVDHPAGRLRAEVHPAGLPDEAVLNLGTLVLDGVPPSVAGCRFLLEGVAYPPEAVPLAAGIELRFSEAMDREWLAAHPGWIVLERLAGAGWSPAGLASVVTADGTLFVAQPEPLTDSSTYRLTIAAGLPDSNGNPMAEAAVFTFRSVDLTPPWVESLSPPSGSVEVAPGTAVLAVFSEALQPGSGLVEWERNGVPEDALASPGGGGEILFIEPAGGLIADSRYRFRLLDWRDPAGNLQAVAAEGVFETVDTQPPEISTPLCGQVTAEPRPEIVCAFTDAMRGVDPATVQARLYDSGGTAWPLETLSLDDGGAIFRPASALPDGDWLLEAEVADWVGNVGRLNCAFAVLRPAITFVGHTPAEPLVVDVTPLVVEVRFQSAWPPAAWELRVNGVELAGASLGGGSGLWMVAGLWTPLLDGPVQVDSRVTDQTGFVSDLDRFEFAWDGLPPAVTLELPGIADRCDPRPPVAFLHDDAGSGVDLAGIRVWLDGEDRTAEFQLDEAGGEWLSAQAAPLGGGSHRLEVEVPDGAGHVARASGDFLLDGDPPEVLPASPAYGAEVTADTVVFDLQVADLCGVAPGSARMLVNGADQPAFQLDSGRIYLEVSWDDPMLQLGDNSWRLTVADELGNVAASEGVFRVIRTIVLPWRRADGNGYAASVDESGVVSLATEASPAGVGVSLAGTAWVDGVVAPLSPRPEAVLWTNGAEVGLEEAIPLGEVVFERRVLVDASGYCIRLQNWLENSSPVPVAAAFEESLQLPAGLAWAVVDSSDGDSLADPLGEDVWFAVDDGIDRDDRFEPNLPVYGLLLASAGAPAPPSLIEPGAEGLRIRWEGLQVPAAGAGGPGRLGLVLVISAQPDRTSARAAMERLELLPEELYAGLGAASWPDVANLALAGGPASLDPVPLLAGGVLGRLLDATPEAHALSFADVLARGEHPLLRRCRRSLTDGEGRFRTPDQPALPLGPAAVFTGSVGCDWIEAGQLELTEAEPWPAELELVVPGTGAVEATVRLGTGALLPSGEVRVADASGRCVLTAPVGAGRACLGGVPAGAYTLSVSSVFGEVDQSLDVPAGETVRPLLELPGQFLSGRVCLPDGRGVAGVRVIVCDAWDHETLLHSSLTDPDGFFAYPEPAVEQDLDLLAIHPDGRSREERFVRVPAGEGLALAPIVLHSPGGLRVRVEDGGAQPVSGAAVELGLVSYPAVATWEAETGADGGVLFLALPAGLTLACRVQPASGPALPALEFQLEENGLRELLFNLSGGEFVVSGRLLAADGVTGVPFHSVVMLRELSPGLQERCAETVAGADGGFTFEPMVLPTGRGCLEVDWPSSQGSGRDAVAVDPAGGQTEVDFVSRISVARGQAVNAAGEPVAALAGCAVTPRSLTDPAPAVWTDGGTVTGLGLKPGLGYDWVAQDDAGDRYCATADLPAGGWVLAGVELPPCSPVAVTGRAQAADGVAPLSWWPVSLEGLDLAGEFYPLGWACADADGWFAFTAQAFPTGLARLTVPWPASMGNGQYQLEVDVATGLPAVLTSDVTVVRGQLVDAAGSPVPDSGWLSVAPFDGGEVPPWLSISGGAFQVLGLRPGAGCELGGEDASAGYHCAYFTLPAGLAVVEGVLLPPCERWAVSGTLLDRYTGEELPAGFEVGLEKALADGRFVPAGTTWTAAAEPGQPAVFQFSGDFPASLARLGVRWPASQGQGADLTEHPVTGDLQVVLDAGVTSIRGVVADTGGITLAEVAGFEAIPPHDGLAPVTFEQICLEGGSWWALGLAPDQVYSLVAWDGGLGFYTVEAAVDGAIGHQEGVQLLPAAVSLAEIRLTVQDPAGTPLEGAVVRLDPVGWGWWADAKTSGADGAAVFRDCPPGAWWAWLPYDPEVHYDDVFLGYVYVRPGEVLVERTFLRPPPPEGTPPACQ